MTRHIWLAVFALTTVGSTAQAQRPNERFAGLDRNGDGVVTRDEWRGSEESFRVHDWNNDGMLSGDELRGRGRGRSADPYSRDRVDEADPRTPGEFARLDHNRDGRLSRDEWPSSAQRFRLVDRDKDGVITSGEFLNDDAERVPSDDARINLFDSLDANYDGAISLPEWRWSRASFDARDANRDGRLTREELQRAPSAAPPTRQSDNVAYRAGAARGLSEGRAAGREDKERNQGWDLDGQRELEQADSGYSPNVGAREDYQAGYREAFRRGYREGYGPR